MDCPRSLYLSLLDYCQNKTVKIPDWEGNISKIISKGCPQGSILDPEFWSIIMEPLLKNLEDVDSIKTSVAYADDILILIEGNNRRKLEERGREALAAVNSWCTFDKLNIATSKTSYMLLRGTLVREPSIRLGVNKISRQGY